MVDLGAGRRIDLRRTVIAPLEYGDELSGGHQVAQLGDNAAERTADERGRVVGVFVVEPDSVQTVFLNGMGQDLGELRGPPMTRC